MKVFIDLDLSDNLDLVAIGRQIKLQLALQETEFKSLTGLEELGIAAFVALAKAGVYKEKPKKGRKN